MSASEADTRNVLRARRWVRFTRRDSQTWRYALCGTNEFFTLAAATQREEIGSGESATKFDESVAWSRENREDRVSLPCGRLETNPRFEACRDPLGGHQGGGRSVDEERCHELSGIVRGNREVADGDRVRHPTRHTPVTARLNEALALAPLMVREKHSLSR